MDYEEIEFVCEGCGKKVKRVRQKKEGENEYLCQQCGKKLDQAE